MHLNPNITLTERQFLALQEAAIKRNTSVEQMIQQLVVQEAVKQITSTSHPRDWITDYPHPNDGMTDDA